MEKEERGWTTIAVSAGRASKDRPRGGNYERLDRLSLCPGESMDHIIGRLLDSYEKGMDDGK